jgi:hypothetical protein
MIIKYNCFEINYSWIRAKLLTIKYISLIYSNSIIVQSDERNNNLTIIYLTWKVLYHKMMIYLSDFV